MQHTNTTMGCCSNAFSLLSLCLLASRCLSLSHSLLLSLSLVLITRVSDGIATLQQVARDNKRQQMEKKGKQAQMLTSDRDTDTVSERAREREKVIGI